MIWILFKLILSSNYCRKINLLIKILWKWVPFKFLEIKYSKHFTYERKTKSTRIPFRNWITIRNSRIYNSCQSLLRNNSPYYLHSYSYARNKCSSIFSKERSDDPKSYSLLVSENIHLDEYDLTTIRNLYKQFSFFSSLSQFEVIKGDEVKLVLKKLLLVIIVWKTTLKRRSNLHPQL